MAASTECAGALLSFRYPSIKDKLESLLSVSQSLHI